MPDKLDQPFYTLAADGNHIHTCTRIGHSHYWLNVKAKLWNCCSCHPSPKGAIVEVRPVEELEARSDD